MLEMLLYAGVLIVLVLVIIAVHLLHKLYVLRKLQKKKLEMQTLENNRALIAQRKSYNKSIQILAGALLQNELTLTEASIRIAGLLDALNVDESVRAEFSALYQLRDATQQIPILQAWAELSAKQQYAFNKERLRHEAVYNDFIVDAIKRIQGKYFS
jgi:hypothetical protein